MKRILYLALIPIIIGSASACNDKDTAPTPNEKTEQQQDPTNSQTPDEGEDPLPGTGYYRAHFISDYCCVETIELEKKQAGITPGGETTNEFFYVNLSGHNANREQNESEFINYARKYGDLSFNQVAERFFAIGQSIVEIDAVCDRDFDAEHPAGSSLGDLYRIVTHTVYPFVRDGYDPEKHSVWGDEIDVKLCDLTEEEGKMWSDVTTPPAYLYTTAAPAQRGSYLITFRFTLDDGKTFEIPAIATF